MWSTLKWEWMQSMTEKKMKMEGWAVKAVNIQKWDGQTHL